MRTHRLRTAAFLTLACAAAAARPAAAQFGSNLITNGNAEAGVGGTGTGGVVPGWTTTGDLTVIKYGTSDYPGMAAPGPADRGANFFGGGYAAASSGTQLLDLTGYSGLATLIDAGDVSFTLSGWLGGFSSQNDNATLTATFLDAGMAPIGSLVTLGPVLAADRGNTTGLLFRTTGGFLPTGTRGVQFSLSMTRSAGSSNDGYADNLSFTLADMSSPHTTVPEPATVALVGAGLALAGVAARRRVRA